jgi:hypothetical protein
MLAGWCAIAAAILTVTGLITLLAFFGTGSALLGAFNDLNTILMAVVTVPVALALYPVGSRTSGPLATIALGADLIGVLLAAGFSALLLAAAPTNGAKREGGAECPVHGRTPWHARGDTGGAARGSSSGPRHPRRRGCRLPTSVGRSGFRHGVVHLGGSEWLRPCRGFMSEPATRRPRSTQFRSRCNSLGRRKPPRSPAITRPTGRDGRNRCVGTGGFRMLRVHDEACCRCPIRSHELDRR